MPKWTNKHNLPQPVVDMVTNDRYDKGDAEFSITQLAKPPRQVRLLQLHSDEITKDVSDAIASLLGQLMHLGLERANRLALAEKRFYAEVEGIRISGQLDAVYDLGLVQDYKLAPIAKFEPYGVPEDYVWQLNCYAWLLRQHRMEITALQIVAFFRDWFLTKSVFDPSYPQTQCQVYDVPVLDNQDIEDYIKERVRLHVEAKTLLPECSDKDRWATKDKWAVMPYKGAPKSKKNHDNKSDAETHAKTIKGAFVEFRPGDSTKGCRWCDARPVCSQYKALINSTPKTKKGPKNGT